MVDWQGTDESSVGAEKYYFAFGSPSTNQNCKQNVDFHVKHDDCCRRCCNLKHNGHSVDVFQRNISDSGFSYIPAKPLHKAHIEQGAPASGASHFKNIFYWLYH